MAYAGGTAAAHYEATIQATKASGAIIQLEPNEFLKILFKTDKPLVVSAMGGWLNKSFRYLTAYKGLIFFTNSSFALNLPGSTEIVGAKRIWIPG